MGKRKAQTRQCSKVERHLFHRSGRWWPGRCPKACPRGFRTCVCANTYSGGWHNAREKDQAARKGKWSPRGTGTTVLTYSCPTASRRRWQKGVCARVTGKAGENGQYSGVMGGSSPKTVGSRCGDSSKALASSCSILGGVTGRSYSREEGRRLNVQSSLREFQVYRSQHCLVRA